MGAARREVPRQVGPELYQAIRAERARRSLAQFIRYGWQVLEPGVEVEWNWHIEFVAEHLQAVLEDWMRRQRDPLYVQRAQNLLINQPPGTAKSRIVSVFAPVWMWLHWPSWRVTCLSANPEVALRDADYARQVLESEWYRTWFRPRWHLREAQDAKSNYANTAGGTRLSKGISAKLTGLRGDAIIADDLNDLKEVYSETIRRGVNRDWDDAIANRVNDLRSSVRIGIQQRAHEEDWSGHILAKGGWEHVCLPMEWEAAPVCKCPSCARGVTFLGRRDPRTAVGEVLHPVRFTPQVLAAEKIRLGSYGVAGQLQQRPAPAEGGMFKQRWFKYIDRAELPSFDEVVVSVDCASKKTTDGSNTAIEVIGRQGPWRYVLDCFAGHVTTRETIAKIHELRGAWGVRKVLVEDKAAGPSVVEALKESIPGVIEIGVAGGDDKESRAMAVQPEVESGNVMLLRGAPWVEDFLLEICSFPVGAKNDRVDAFTQALNYFRENPRVRAARALAT